MSFFGVSDNSIRNTNFPWIEHSISGVGQSDVCAACERTQTIANGYVEIALSLEKGEAWPDVLGGAVPLFIVSERVLETWQAEHIYSPPYHNISILGSLPELLQNVPPPKYYWIDGQKMQGALVDFDAAGYIEVKFCPKYGIYTYDINKTFDRQHSQPWSWSFIEGSWNGLKLFTTDVSKWRFFCTDEVFECAKKYRLTNFRFTAAEHGDKAPRKIIDYLNG